MATETLVFRLAGSEWGLPARQVRQVLPPGPVTRLPGAAPPLCGLIAWRAQLLPVYNPAGDGSARAQGVLLVVDAPGEPALPERPSRSEPVALWVDEVIGFVLEPESQMPSTPPFDLAAVLGER